MLFYLFSFNSCAYHIFYPFVLVLLKSNLLQLCLLNTAAAHNIAAILFLSLHSIKVICSLSFFAELLGDLLKRKPKFLEGTESLIVVDNVPTVGPDRLDKLKNVIGKVFGKFGKITSEFYPDENGLTKG